MRDADIPTKNIEPHAVAAKSAEIVLRHLWATGVITEKQALAFQNGFNEVAEAFATGKTVELRLNGTYAINKPAPADKTIPYIRSIH